ncbi:MAG TPA: hypothetical protein VG015_10050 [Candidatus Dormibacteraeota bacterium]|jgi:hypothetical protein|nr:hypothetical protein [Candidatus Dormibacteraeota bacterium]
MAPKSPPEAAIRYRRTASADLVHTLNQLVEDLVKENRRLQRQLEKQESERVRTTEKEIARGLRTLQARLEKATAKPAVRRSAKAPTGN